MCSIGVIGPAPPSLELKPSQYPMAEFAHPLRPWTGHGAHRQCRRSKGGGRGHEGAACSAGTSQRLLLGRSHGRADARRLGVDCAQGRKPRPGRQVHARGRGQRGQQPQARRDGESALSAARTLRRSTARSLEMRARRSPNTRQRSRPRPIAIVGSLGVARAADASGDRTKAAEYYAKLVDLAKNADVDRQEVREAKAFLERK